MKHTRIMRSLVVSSFAMLVAGAGLLSIAAPARADTISPDTFSTTLGLGESTTIRKTVVVEQTTSTAVLDVMFVFDVTGSMRAEAAAARNTANSVLSSLSGFGDLQSGSGWYRDPTHDGVHVDLNSGNTGVSSGINDMGTTISISGGGDFAEVGYAAIRDAANDASWRTGSNRVMVVFGDASFKNGPGVLDNATATSAALAANGIDLIGVSFSSAFSSSITGLGGTVFSGGASGANIAQAIIDGVTSTFQNYTEVTVDDLGGGLPGVGVSVACVSAAAGGACSGDTAVGTWDRSTDRTFEFDVTFTGLAPGVHEFPTHALVDGAIVATEKDSITVRRGGGTAVPGPAALVLIGSGLLGLGVFGRRRRVV